VIINYHTCLNFGDHHILARQLNNDEPSIIEELISTAKSDKLRVYLNNIKLKHSERKIYDYHSYKKFLEFLDKLTDQLRDVPVKMLNKDWKKFETDKDRDDEIQWVHKRVDEIRKIYEEAYQKFEESLDWCEERSYKPIYLCRDECKTDQNLFLDSSYILPDDYEYIRNNWNGALG